jgi:hypothetical protein
MIRGERGDNRELKPQFFYLECPSCGKLRDCAHVKLFTTTARTLTCSNCKKSTSSTKWSCEHGTPWTKCSIHRELGFRCGRQSLPSINASSQGKAIDARSFKAIQRRQAKLRAIGSLGEPKSPPISCDNLVNSSRFKRTSVLNKNLKRRGRPTRSGDTRSRRPELHAKNSPHSSLGISSDDHPHRIDYASCMSTSMYWHAHARHDQQGATTTSDKHIQTLNHKAGSVDGEPLNPAKRARISEPFSKHNFKCKGLCPLKWTIESYCEVCHG